MAPLIRPAAVGGGAAGVAALIGNPLVGTAFILELGRRRSVPLSAERVTAALVGGLVGWAINVAFDLDLIRLNVPDVAPDDLLEALATALLVGCGRGDDHVAHRGGDLPGARVAGLPGLRLVLGGLAVAVAAIADRGSRHAVGGRRPRGRSGGLGRHRRRGRRHLAGRGVLRAVATTAAVAAGGCGGVFVPFLAIGDIAGRAFAPTFGLPGDLAGAAGAAGGIAGGYRLPFTAVAMVLGLGGPSSATLTCLATVGVATVAGLGAGLALDRLTELRSSPASETR